MTNNTVSRTFWAAPPTAIFSLLLHSTAGNEISALKQDEASVYTLCFGGRLSQGIEV